MMTCTSVISRILEEPDVSLFPLNMEAADFCKKLVTAYETTQCYSPENDNIERVKLVLRY
jgi:hypothetical protein